MEGRGPQRMFCGPAASVSSGNSLKMQVPGPPPRPAESEPQGWGQQSVLAIPLGHSGAKKSFKNHYFVLTWGVWKLFCCKFSVNEGF